MIQIFPDFIQNILLTVSKSYFQKIHLTTAEWFAELGISQELQAVLDSQFGDYGLIAEESSVVMHAMLVKHYFYGAYFPEGGGRSFSQAIRQNISENQLTTLLAHEVLEILIDKNEVQGIRCKDLKSQVEKIFRSDIVISNVGLQNTFEKLVTNDYGKSEREESRKVIQGCSALNVYLAFSEDPRKFGFQGENYWISKTYDQKKMISEIHDIENFHPQHMFLSMSSLNDPSAQKWTAQAISIGHAVNFEKWKGSNKKNRPEDYVVFKSQILKKYLDFLESEFPGINEKIIFSELATPLTFEHYSSHRGGQIYGVPFTPARLKMKSLKPQTTVRNLYLTGADITSCGVAGALLSGVLTCSSILGFKIFSKVFRPVQQN